MFFKKHKFAKIVETDKTPNMERWKEYQPEKVNIAILTPNEKEQIAEAFAIASCFYGSITENEFMGDAKFLVSSIPLKFTLNVSFAATKLIEVVIYLQHCSDFVVQRKRTKFEFLEWAKYKILNGIDNKDIVFTESEICGFDNAMFNILDC